MVNMDDRSLLHAYVEKSSEEAFGTLVSRHLNLVYATALRHVRNPQLAQDISQAVFIILARKAGSLRPEIVLSGWLYRTTRYAAADALKAEFRRQRREQEAQMEQVLNTDEHDSTWRRLEPVLDDALARLGEKDRDAILLRYFENKSLNDVGLALGTNENTARMRVSRAIEKLRSLLARRRVIVPAVALTGALAAKTATAAPAGLAGAITTTAVAKGTVISGSTLAIMQGTLKLMAWAKVKTATAIGMAAFFAIGVPLLAVDIIQTSGAATAPDIQGAWEGVLETGKTGIQKGETEKTRVVIRIVKTNGNYRASGDLVDEGRKNIPLRKFVYHYPSLHAEATSWAFYEGTVNAEGTEISGNYLEGGNPTHIVLKRTDTPSTTPERLTESDFAPRNNSPLQGYWKGNVDFVALSWKIAGNADGTFRAELDNPEQGAVSQPVSVSWNRPAVKLTLMTGSGMVEGTLNSSGTEIVGNWIQGGKATPTTLKRADREAELALEARKNYAFTSPTDLQGHWKANMDVGPLLGIKAKTAMALDIARLPDGSFSSGLGFLDPDFQLLMPEPFRATSVKHSPPNVVLVWRGIGCVFRGELKDGKLSGNLRQGGVSMPLIFERRETK